jgi:hypothetical protein
MSLADVETDVLQHLYWTMPVHTDAASAKLDIIQRELVRRGVGLRDAVTGVSKTQTPGCDGVGVCTWCNQEVVSGHLCEPMCDNVDAVLVLEQFRKELLT